MSSKNGLGAFVPLKKHTFFFLKTECMLFCLSTNKCLSVFRESVLAWTSGTFQVYPAPSLVFSFLLCEIKIIILVSSGLSSGFNERSFLREILSTLGSIPSRPPGGFVIPGKQLSVR